MKKIVEYKDRNPTHSFSTIKNRFCKLTKLDQINKFRKHLETNGSRNNHLQSINSYVLQKYRFEMSNILNLIEIYIFIKIKQDVF